eukprot:2924780-Pyramimonas_sp.AAC.1
MRDIYVNVPLAAVKAIGPIPEPGDFSDLTKDLKDFLEPRLGASGTTYMASGGGKERGVELLNEIYQKWVLLAWGEVI